MNVSFSALWFLEDKSDMVQAVRNITLISQKKMNQNEVVRICTNFFEYFRTCTLIHENEFVIDDNSSCRIFGN